MKTKKKFTAKTYRLKRDAAPLTYMLASSHSKRANLLYFDEEKGINRQLRYARNQRSPFVDEQDGNAIMEPIIFEDGMLNVQKENQILQEFLYYHPMRGMVFEEVNHEKDATQDVKILETELDAQIAAKNLPFEKLVAVSRVLLGGSADRMSTAELRRDILLFAKEDPYTFMEVINDPELDFEDEVRRFFDNNLLVFRNKRKDVYYNLKGNKKKMLTIPFNEEAYHVVGSFLKSDEGVEVYKTLVKLLND
tara:strand:- start:548 stop:1297 length:750 start_codon:yes stop_codon:yes gene_type:complete